MLSLAWTTLHVHTYTGCGHHSGQFGRMLHIRIIQNCTRSEHTYRQISGFQRPQTQGTNNAIIGQVPTVKGSVIKAYPIPTRMSNSGGDTLSLSTINSRLVELLLLFRRCREFVTLGNCIKLQNSPFSAVVWTNWHVTKPAISSIERDSHKDCWFLHAVPAHCWSGIRYTLQPQLVKLPQLISRLGLVSLGRWSCSRGASCV